MLLWKSSWMLKFQNNSMRIFKLSHLVIVNINFIQAFSLTKCHIHLTIAIILAFNTHTHTHICSHHYLIIITHICYWTPSLCERACFLWLSSVEAWAFSLQTHIFTDSHHSVAISWQIMTARRKMPLISARPYGLHGAFSSTAASVKERREVFQRVF